MIKQEKKTYSAMSALFTLACALTAAWSDQGQLAWAGTPDQDPVVKQLQLDFQQAYIPSNSKLQFGKTWYCTQYSALKDNFEKFVDQESFRFVESTDTIVNEVGGVLEYEYSPYGDALEGYLDSKKQFKQFIRANSRGDLLVEWTGTPYIFQQHGLEGVEAISTKDFINPALRLKAISYMFCPRDGAPTPPAPPAPEPAPTSSPAPTP